MKKLTNLILIAGAFLCSCSFELQESSTSFFSEEPISSLAPIESISSLESSIIENEKETFTAPLFNEAVGVSLETNAGAWNDVYSRFGDIISGMEVKNVYQDNAGVKLGSSSSSGIWTLTFKHKIESVRYKARGYTKYDNYNQIWRNDSPEYKLNGETFSISDSSNGTDEAQFIFQEAVINSNTLTFETIAGRLVINSIELTYSI